MGIYTVYFCCRMWVCIDSVDQTEAVCDLVRSPLSVNVCESVSLSLLGGAQAASAINGSLVCV